MILSIDHIVLTVKDMDKTILFYRDVLGMTFHSFCPEGGTEKKIFPKLWQSKNKFTSI